MKNSPKRAKRIEAVSKNCKYKFLTRAESLTEYSRYLIVSQHRSIEYSDSPKPTTGISWEVASTGDRMPGPLSAGLTINYDNQEGVNAVARQN